MVLNKQWQADLRKLHRNILFWKNHILLNEYAKHNLTRSVLYSAVIIRKLIDNNNEINLKVPSSLNCTRYPYVGDFELMVPGKIWCEDYDKGENAIIEVKDVCNQIIHSYLWDIAHLYTSKKFYGFFVASDFNREKFINLISFDEWASMLKSIVNSDII